MTTLGEMRTELHRAVGDNSTGTDAILLRAINAGIVAASILFEPPELRTSANITAASTSKTANVANGLTRHLKIDEVWNANANGKVWPLALNEMHALESLMPANGNVLFYALHGQLLHYRPQPTANQTLTVYYLQRANRVVNANDTIPLEDFEEFIMSFAMEFFWAFKEEGESQQGWQQISDRLGIPYGQLAQVRRALRGDAPDDHNVRGAVQPGTVATGS